MLKDPLKLAPDYSAKSFSIATKSVIYCFMWEFGVFDKFLYLNAYKTLVALRDVYGYSKNILSWENITKKQKVAVLLNKLSISKW